MPRPRRAAPARFGLRLPPPEVDWAGVRAHVQGAIARIAPNDSAARFRGMGVEVVEASAHFLGPDAIEAGGRRLGFRRCVIAAGSAAVVPDLPGLDGVPWLTNETHLRPGGAARPPADPRRRADRAGDGAGPCAPRLPA